MAAQVLYWFTLLAGRQNDQIFSVDAAKRMAVQLEAKGKDDLDFNVNILVLGISGVGKRATINSIFGEEKAPIDAFETGTTSVKEISGLVDGVKAYNRNVLSYVKKFTKKGFSDVVLYVDRLDAQTRDLNDAGGQTDCLKASENAQEVSKMLEAKRMHYHSSDGSSRGDDGAATGTRPSQPAPSPLPSRFSAHNIPVQFVGTTTYNT
ncbi:Small monomeric GTPase [Forsythia ovata]|uniref:Small monomeric GTPase n=1 Tax=Forsythia ovata TaxID=205694 RepID=A0ABD1UCB8_9LAMI